jgi:hypothetical protein
MLVASLEAIERREVTTDTRFGHGSHVGGRGDPFDAGEVNMNSLLLWDRNLPQQPTRVAAVVDVEQKSLEPDSFVD